MSKLRSLVKIDQLQSQCARYLSQVFKVEVPAAACVALLDISPATAAERALGGLFKAAEVQSNLVVFDGGGGWVGIHSNSADEIQAAIDAALDEVGLESSTCKPFGCVNPELIARIDERHAEVINQRSKGSALAPGDSLWVADFMPASGALLAANLAECQANIKLVDCKAWGSSGRLYLAGDDAELRCASEAIYSVMG